MLHAAGGWLLAAGWLLALCWLLLVGGRERR